MGSLEKELLDLLTIFFIAVGSTAHMRESFSVLCNIQVLVQEVTIAAPLINGDHRMVKFILKGVFELNAGLWH